jgi:predicted PurR-regulated permease PerM
MTDQDEHQKPDESGKLPVMVFDRRLLFLAFFFAVFLFLLYQLVLVLTPFLASVLGGLMLTFIFFPLHARLQNRIRSPNLCAATSTLIVLITIIVPVFIMTWTLVNEASELLPIVREWIGKQQQEGFSRPDNAIAMYLLRFWERISPYLDRWDIDLQSMTAETIRQLGNTITTFGTETLKEVTRLIINLLFLIMFLFFFFRDGKSMVKVIIDLVPMEEENKQFIVTRLDRTLVAIIRGAFITCSIQGMLTGVGLAVAGVPFAVLLGFTAALLAVVPFVGASLVWAPAAFYLLLIDEIFASIGLALWGLFVVGLIDNFLRPFIVGKHAQLPILLLFIAILGGLQVYGLVGVLIAPLVVASVIAFAQIYHEQYLLKNPVEGHPDKMPDNL